MTQEELGAFIEAVIEASRFSPNIYSETEQRWRDIIEANGGLPILRERIAEIEAAR